MASEVAPVLNGHYDRLACSMCSELLKDPVTLECMHNFCASCFIRLYGNSSGCPLCHRPISCFAVKPNPLLQKIVELIKMCTTPEYFGQVQNDLRDIIKAKENHIQSLTKKKQEAKEKICNAEKSGEETRLKIAEQFQNLHSILNKEEETLLSSVNTEEAAAVSHLQETVQKFEKQIQNLSNDLVFIKETLRKTGDCLFPK